MDEVEKSRAQMTQEFETGRLFLFLLILYYIFDKKIIKQNLTLLALVSYVSVIGKSVAVNVH